MTPFRCAAAVRTAVRAAVRGTVRTGVCVALAAGCGSGARATSHEPPPPVPRPDARVSIPASVTAELDAWMAEPVALIADVIRVDATAIPFASQIAVEASRDTDAQGRRSVERTESSDPATGVATLLLVNRSGMWTTLDTLPRIRLAGERQFIARDRLELRYVPAPGADRPVVFRAVGEGDARLVSPSARATGPRLGVSGEIARDAADGAYSFRGRTEP